MGEQLRRAFARSRRALVSLAAVVPCMVALILVGGLLQTVADGLARKGAAGRGTLLAWARRGPAEALAAQAERLPGVAGTVTLLDLPLPNDPLQDAGWRGLRLWAAHSTLPGWAFAPPSPGLALAAGRYPQRPEEALVGYELARRLGLQVGSTVWVQERAFTVCGVWQAGGLAPGNFLQVPYEAAALLTPAGGEPQPVIVLLEEGASPAAALAELRARLPDAAVMRPEDLVEEERRFSRMLALAVGALALLAALSSGPAAVHALRPLAGSRLEVAGAAGVLGALGGGLSLCLAWAATHALNALARESYALTPLRLSPTPAALALFWPALSGVAAGLSARRGRAGELGRLWRYGVASATVALAVMAALLAGSLEESLSLALARTGAGHASRLSVTAAGQPLSDAMLARASGLPGFQGLLVEAYGGALVEAEDGWPGRPPSGVLYGIISPLGETGAEVPYPVRLAAGRALEGPHETIVGAELARSRGLAPGDVLSIRGRDFSVVGIRERFPYDALSPVNYRADVSLEALRDLLGEPELAGRVTLIVPPIGDVEARAPYLQQVSRQMGGARVTGADEAMAEVAARYPGGRPLTGQEPEAQVRGLYQRLLLVWTALAVVVGGLAVANALYPVYLEQRREIAVQRLVGAGPGHILAGYLWCALAVAGVGTLVGSYAAWAWAGALNAWFRGSEAWPALAVTPRLLAPVGGLEVVGAVLLALYPGLRAAAVDPARVLNEKGVEGDAPQQLHLSLRGGGRSRRRSNPQAGIWGLLRCARNDSLNRYRS